MTIYLCVLYPYIVVARFNHWISMWISLYFSISKRFSILVCPDSIFYHKRVIFCTMQRNKMIGIQHPIPIGLKAHARYLNTSMKTIWFYSLMYQLLFANLFRKDRIITQLSYKWTFTAFHELQWENVKMNEWVNEVRVWGKQI